MAEMMTCPVCKGSKVRMGDGYVEHECEYCKGKGIVEKEEVKETPLVHIAHTSKFTDELAVAEDKKPIKMSDMINTANKKGRPKKNG
jgi:DnaJ-class molecular chaperone